MLTGCFRHRPDGIRSGAAGRYSLLSRSIISQPKSVFKYRIMKFLCIFVQRKKRDIMLMILGNANVHLRIWHVGVIDCILCGEFTL